MCPRPRRAETAAFVDTNIFLHYQPFDQIPWSKVLSATRVSIIVGDEVIGELDKRKDSDSKPKIRDKARKAIKLLLDIITNRAGCLNDFVEVQYWDGLSADDRIEIGLDPARTDDRLLAAALKYRSQHDGVDVCIVTRDAGLRLKAWKREMRVVELPMNYLAKDAEMSERAFPPEPQVPEPKLNVLLEDGTDSSFWTVEREEKTNIRAMRQYIKRHIKPLFTRRETNQHAKEIEELEKVKDNSAQAPLMQFVSRLSLWVAEHHNAALDEYYDQYLEYWTQWIDHRNAMRRSRSVPLIIENQGDVPAVDVHVFVRVPVHLILCPDGKFPSAPQPPKPPQPLAAEASAPSAAAEHAGILIKRTTGTLVHTRKLREHWELVFHVERLNQHLYASLPTWGFTFPSADQIGEFDMLYQITSSNARTKATGRILFKPASPTG